MIRFSRNDFSVNIAGKTISLLPKEFALLQFLWENRNRSFSREQLLDAVWGLENPGERTVDDHIYRIRGKLKDFSHVVKIDTVRGLGYRLAFRETAAKSPLQGDSELNERYAELFTKYWRYGHGSALGILAENRDVLGITLDPERKLFLSFITGEFQKVVRTTEVPFFGKAFYLLHIFRIIQFDAAKTLNLFERALAQGHRFPQHHRDELEFNIINVYCEAGEIEKAERRLQLVEQEIGGDPDHGYTLFLYAYKIMLNWLKGDFQVVEQCLAEAEELLVTRPYLRERGILKVAGGLWLLRHGRQGEKVISEGLDLLKKSQFVPHYLLGVYLVLFFLHGYIEDASTLQKYTDLWSQLDRVYNFEGLSAEIYHFLTSRL